jgi:hypothetical protein
MSAQEEAMLERTKQSLIAIAVLALAGTAGAETKPAAIDAAKPPELTAEVIVQRHLAALGGEKLLRGGKTLAYTVSGEKLGKKFTKTVRSARPNKVRVDITSDDGNMSKGYDGTIAWAKKGTAAAEKLDAEGTQMMAQHAAFEEPLVDYVKKGTAIRLAGTSEVERVPAYDLEVTYKTGEVEHHFIDAKTFLLAKRTFTAKDKDGKAYASSVRFGDYKNVQGRMVNHSIAWDGDDGKTYKSIVSNVKFDSAIDAKLFAMPK